MRCWRSAYARAEPSSRLCSEQCRQLRSNGGVRSRKQFTEQEVFAGCAVSTGGQPYAFAGCVGSQLTKMELQKCFTHGIGGSGCFGQNNTVVKFVNNAWKDVTEGPGPSNDLLGRDGFIGRKLRDAEGDLRYGAGSSNDLVGRCGFMGRTLLVAVLELAFFVAEGGIFNEIVLDD